MEGGNDQVYHVIQKIGNGVPYDLAYYAYDHLGRVVVKQFPAANVLQEYNIRGFLNHIKVANMNNVSDSNHIFEENLYYDKGFKSTLYNGNIAGITWRKAGDAAPVEAYGYNYDPLSRLTHAEYRRAPLNSDNWQNNLYNYTASNISYDYNGNLLSMDQEAPDMQPGGSTVHMDQLAYSYAPTSNKLIKVHDDGVTVAALPDFKDNADLSEEYDYDLNGNMIADANKGISAIEYNYLNKPDRITVDNKGIITYVYDGAGNRLRKKVQNTNTNLTEVYDYIGNFVYKDSTLQYILNEEGRTRPIPIESGTQPGKFTTKFVYDYFVKDHLGNVRSTVTATPMDGIYLAKHEIASANVEQLVFDNIPSVRDNKPGSLSVDDGMAARLDGGDVNRRVGTAIMLHTMPGDHFNLSVDAYYDGSYTQDQEVAGDEVIGALMGALTGGADFNGVPLSELPNNVRLVTGALNNPLLAGQLNTLLESNNNPNAPKAHLNYLFFNEKLEFLPGHSGSVQVMENPMGWTTINPSMVGGSITGGSQVNQVTTYEPGYIIIFIDNQSVGKEVWFDNLMVGMYKGQVAEENHYYPFGLTMETSAMASGVTKNDIKFQNQRHEDDFGINMYSFKYRDHDPQIGRFWEIDPLSEKYVYNSTYAFSENKVVNAIELEGLESLKLSDYLWRGAGINSSTDAKQYVKEVAKEQSKPENIVRNVGAASSMFGQTVGVAFLTAVMTGGVGEGAVIEEGIAAARMTAATEGTEASTTTIFRSISEAEAENISSTGQLSFGEGQMEVKQFWLEKSGLDNFNKTGFGNGFNLELNVPKSIIGDVKPINTAVQVDTHLGTNGTIDSKSSLQKVNGSIRSFNITPFVEEL